MGWDAAPAMTQTRNPYPKINFSKGSHGLGDEFVAHFRWRSVERLPSVRMSIQYRALFPNTNHQDETEFHNSSRHFPVRKRLPHPRSACPAHYRSDVLRRHRRLVRGDQLRRCRGGHHESQDGRQFVPGRQFACAFRRDFHRAGRVGGLHRRRCNDSDDIQDELVAHDHSGWFLLRQWCRSRQRGRRRYGFHKQQCQWRHGACRAVLGLDPRQLPCSHGGKELRLDLQRPRCEHLTSRRPTYHQRDDMDQRRGDHAWHARIGAVAGFIGGSFQLRPRRALQPSGADPHGAASGNSLA